MDAPRAIEANEQSVLDEQGGGGRAPVRRAGGWLLAATVLVAVAYPPAMSLHREGLQGAFRYFAADTFYYLSVADRSTGQPYFTFDGTHPTNGFHPLWQLYLERGFAWLGLEGADQVVFAAVSSIVLVALGTALFALVLLSLTRRPWLALLGAVPGLYYLVVPTLNAHHFAQWSFANGMESPLSILFFGILLVGLFVGGWARPEAPARARFMLSGVLTALVLSRLDDVFVFVPFLLFAALAAGSRAEAVRRVVGLSVVPAIAIGGYLLYNFLYAESLMPSSGAAKSQPLWALARNLYAVWTTALPFADPLARDVAVWKSEAWRVLQMLVPAIAAVAWLLARPMSFRAGEGTAETRRNGLIGLLAVYVIAKAAYNFAMVGLWHQGQWYYPLSIMTFNLIAATAAAGVLDQVARARRAVPAGGPTTLLGALRARWPASGRGAKAAPLVLAAVAVLVSANAFVDLKQNGGHQRRNFEFWLERDATRFLLQQSCPGCGVLAFDDGIVAYSLEGTPTLNGLGLVLDRTARDARARGRLLDVAWSRGHRIFASVNYAMPADAYASEARLRESLARNRHFAGQNLDDWEFELAFRSPTTGVSFVRFEPRDAARVERFAPRGDLARRGPASTRGGFGEAGEADEGPEVARSSPRTTRRGRAGPIPRLAPATTPVLGTPRIAPLPRTPSTTRPG